MLVGKMEVRVKVHNMTKKDFVLVIPSDDASTPATVLRAPLTLFLKYHYDILFTKFQYLEPAPP